jgi:hypothetical protein
MWGGYMKKNREGSITVFLCSILLIVIILTCTVIDTTRIKVAKVQSRRALRDSTNSILANYDSDICNEYGIFAIEQKEDLIVKDNIEDYANASLNPKTNFPKTNNIYEYLYPNNTDKTFNLYNYKLKVLNVNPTNYIVQDTDYIKLQILEYMKYRTPLLLIEPFIDKIKIVKKSSKTTTYVNRKINITEKVSKIDEHYRELEKLIDGIEVSNKGNIQYEKIFVKGLLTNKEINKSACLSEIPNNSIRNNLQNNIYDVNEDISNLLYYLDNFNSSKKIMINTYKQLYYIRKEINYLEKDEVLDNATIEELMIKYKEEKELKNLFFNQVENVKYYINNINQSVNNISNLRIYLDKNKKAIEVIKKIEAEGNKVKGSIEKFQNDIKLSSGELIESTANILSNDMEKLKHKLAIVDNEDKSYLLVNNLYAIQEELQNNIEIITNKLPYIDDLINQNNNLINHMLDGEFNLNIEEEILYDFIKETDKSGIKIFLYNDNYLQGNNNLTALFNDILNNIKVNLEDYSTKTMIFNYGNMETLSEEEKDKLDPRDDVKESTKNITFNKEEQDLTQNVNKDIIPSIAYSENESIEKINQEVDFYNEKENSFSKQSLNVFDNIASKLEKNSIDFRNDLYINEYIIGNFKSATDNLQEATPVTLSGYSKDKHFFNNEVEYILRGSFDENINLKYVTNRILGIRFVMNYLHIITNSEKRSMVMSISTSIGGWWTFGLGTYLLSGLIMTAWSYAESCVDVRYLLQGKKVAFLKTSGDWYTSLSGIAEGIIDNTAQYTTNKTIKIIDSVSTNVQNKVSFISKRFNSDVSDFAEEKIGEVISDASRALEYTLDEIDNTIQLTINDTINDIRQGNNNQILSRNYPYKGDNKLIKKIINTIYNEYEEKIINATYSEIIIIKKEILEKFQDEIDEIKGNVINDLSKEIDDITSRFESEVNGLIKKTSSRYKDITKNQINNIAQRVKNSTNRKIDTSINNIIQYENNDSKVSSLMPCFSYNDYLRLMLLVGISESTKLYRVLDLIQLNLQKNRKDETELSKFLSGYCTTAEVSINYLFFGLPFMPERAKELDKKRFDFKLSTSMTY